MKFERSEKGRFNHFDFLWEESTFGCSVGIDGHWIKLRVLLIRPNIIGPPVSRTLSVFPFLIFV